MPIINLNRFENYYRKFSTMRRDFDLWLYNFVSQQALEIIAKTKLRTPVDTGNLRAQWRLESITKKGLNIVVWIANPADYASFVEYGHATPYHAGAPAYGPDWVNGYFMLEISMGEIATAMPTRFDSQFRAFLRQRGVL